MNDELEGLDLVGLLDRLGPIPEPAPIPLWPQTEAWGVFALGVIALVAWGVARWLRRRRAEAYRRAALHAIDRDAPSPAALAEILRRTALAAYPRKEVAGLHGDVWLAFLDRTYGGDGFARGPGRVVATAPYIEGREDDAADADLVALARTWIRRHRRSPEVAS